MILQIFFYLYILLSQIDANAKMKLSQVKSRVGSDDNLTQII